MEWVNAHLAAVNSAIALAISVAVYFAFKFRIDFWWLNFWYALPLVGKLARLSRDTTHYAGNQSWTNAERTLCHDYKQFIHLTTEPEFRKRLVYLSKAQDLGRKSLPGWLILLLGLLLIAEGLGFSYQLSTWTARDGSTNMQEVIAIAIVCVLCVILLWSTHSAGHQRFRSTLVRRCEKEWRDNGQPGNLKSSNIRLDEEQSKDDQQPEYTQCINRVGTEWSSSWMYGAIILVALIGGISFWMRMEHLAVELTQETAQAVNPTLSGGGLALPGEVATPQKEVEARALQDVREATRNEGMAAYIMLAVIFIATQAVAVSAGYKWGFAGKESEAAYEGTGGFSTYDDYLRFYDPIIQVARAKLQLLQQRLMERPSNQQLPLRHTFDDFLIENQRPVAVSPVADPRTTATNPVMPASGPTESGIDGLWARYEAIPQTDRDARIQFIKSIEPDTLKEQFKQVLKVRKDAEAKRKAEREDRDLENLV